MSSVKKENSREFFKNPTVTKDISSARMSSKRKRIESIGEESSDTDNVWGRSSASNQRRPNGCHIYMYIICLIIGLNSTKSAEDIIRDHKIDNPVPPLSSSSKKGKKRKKKQRKIASYFEKPATKKSGKEEVKESATSSSSSCLTEEWESKEEMSNIEKIMKYARYGDENNPGTNSFEKVIAGRTPFFKELSEPGMYRKHGKILDPMHYAVLPKEIWDKMYKDNKPTCKTTWVTVSVDIENTKKATNQEFKEGCLKRVTLSVSPNAIGKLKRFRGRAAVNLGTLVLLYSGVNPKDENGEYVIRKGCDFQVDHMTNNPAINIPEELRFIQNPFNTMFQGNGESGILDYFQFGWPLHFRFGKGKKLRLSKELKKLGYEKSPTKKVWIKDYKSKEEAEKAAKRVKRQAYDAATKQLQHLKEPFYKGTYRDKVKLCCQLRLPLHGYVKENKLELSQEMVNLGYNKKSEKAYEDTRPLAIKKKKEAGIAVINQLKKLQPWKFKAYKYGGEANPCVEYSIEDDLRQLFA